jgi:hypothetical protein
MYFAGSYDADDELTDESASGMSQEVGTSNDEDELTDGIQPLSLVAFRGTW